MAHVEICREASSYDESSELRRKLIIRGADAQANAEVIVTCAITPATRIEAAMQWRNASGELLVVKEKDSPTNLVKNDTRMSLVGMNWR